MAGDNEEDEDISLDIQAGFMTAEPEVKPTEAPPLPPPAAETESARANSWQGDGSAFIGTGFSTVSTPIESPFTPASPPPSPPPGKAEAQIETLVDKNADNKHFREACLAFSTAESALENDNFKVALPLLEKAHRLFIKGGARHRPEFGLCLQRLADSLFHENQDKEALDRYQDFLDWDQRRDPAPNAGRIVVLLKLAKTYQRLEEYDEAEATFDRAVTNVNQALAVTHPLFSVVYNTYIAFLSLLDTQPDKLERIKRELADKLMTASSTVAIPDDLKQELSAWTEPEAMKRRSERQRQLRLTKQMFQNEKSETEMMVGRFKHAGGFKSLLGTLVAVLLVGSFGVLVFCCAQLFEKQGTTSGATIDNRLAQYVDKQFASADGLRKMVLTSDGSANLTFGDQNLVMPVKVGPPKQGIYEDLQHLLGNKSDYILEQSKDCFKESDETVLYAPDAREMKIVEVMKQVAELANFYYSRNQRYPKKRSDMTEMSPEITIDNPLGGQKPQVKTFEYDKEDGDVAFSETLAKYAAGKPFFEPDGKPGIPPGLVECLSVVPFDASGNDDCRAFLLRAYDSNGRFITSGVPGRCFVLAFKNGVQASTSKPEELKVPIQNQAKTTVYLNLIR